MRKVLKESQVDIGRSRAQIADRVKEFKREEMRKKIEYENEMIKIYSKVFQRPLLIENGGSPESPTRSQKESRKQKDNEGDYLEDYYQEGEKAPRRAPPPQDLFVDDNARRAAV